MSTTMFSSVEQRLKLNEMFPNVFVCQFAFWRKSSHATLRVCERTLSSTGNIQHHAPHIFVRGGTCHTVIIVFLYSQKERDVLHSLAPASSCFLFCVRYQSDIWAGKQTMEKIVLLFIFLCIVIVIVNNDLQKSKTYFNLFQWCWLLDCW